MSVSEKNAGTSWKFTLFKYMMYAVGDLADEILHEMVLEAQFPQPFPEPQGWTSSGLILMRQRLGQKSLRH